jgi:hypothetical protein
LEERWNVEARTKKEAARKVYRRKKGRRRKVCGKGRKKEGKVKRVRGHE